jgi:hypothetical protein
LTLTTFCKPKGGSNASQVAQRDLTVPTTAVWAYTPVQEDLTSDADCTISVADKSIYDVAFTTIVVTGPSTVLPPTEPFHTSLEAETAATGGAVLTLPNGQQGRKYATNEESTFSVTVPAAGDYVVTVLYNSATRGKDTLVTIYPNNSSLGSKRFDTSANTSKAEATLALKAGKNDLIFVPAPGKALPDLDVVRITGTVPPAG